MQLTVKCKSLVPRAFLLFHATRASANTVHDKRLSRLGLLGWCGVASPFPVGEFPAAALAPSPSSYFVDLRFGVLANITRCPPPSVFPSGYLSSTPAWEWCSIGVSIVYGVLVQIIPCLCVCTAGSTSKKHAALACWWATLAKRKRATVKEGRKGL